VPFCSDVGNGISGRTPESGIKRMITFRWEEVMKAVLRMTNLFEKFLLKIF